MKEIDSGIFAERITSKHLTEDWVFILLDVVSGHPIATEDLGSLGVIAFYIPEDDEIEDIDREFLENQKSPYSWRDIENFSMWKHTSPFFNRHDLEELYQKWRELSGANDRS